MKKKKLNFINLLVCWKKKNFGCKIGWAIAQLYCEKKKNLYCNLGFVLQERGLEKKRLHVFYRVILCFKLHGRTYTRYDVYENCDCAIVA